MPAVLPSGRPNTGAGVQESVPEAAWCVQRAAGPGAAGPPLSTPTCTTGESGHHHLSTPPSHHDCKCL